jgi:hypothetical protein
MNERKQKKCSLRPEWIDWWREMIQMTMNGDYLIQSNQVIYRVDHTNKTVTLVNGLPQHHILDKRCIEACGYKHDVFLDPTAATIVNIMIKDPKTPILMQVAPDLTFFRKGTKS